MKRLYALSAAAILFAGTLGPVAAATPKDTLVIGYRLDEIISLDPAEIFEITTTEIAANSYERLLTYDLKDTSKISGEVAESWTVSPDGKTFTFKIRQGKKFASGNPLTAEDVAFTLQRVVQLGKSPDFILTQFGFTKDNVKDRIKQTGPYELTFETDKPYAPTFVLNCLTSSVSSIVDKKLTMANEKDGDLGYNWLKTHYAGSGAFAIREWRANESVVLERNEHFAKPTPMKRVIYRHIKESATQRLMLEKGDLDIARDLDGVQLDAVAKTGEIKVTSGVKSTVYYLGLNQKNEYLAKPEVREAIRYLVDYKAIANTILKNKGSVHQAFLPEGMLGAVNETPFSLDVAKAKALLEKAGLKDGFKITVDARNSDTMLGIAQAMQQSFGQAGIKLEIIPGDDKQTTTKYRSRQHDIYITQWGADYPDPNTNASTFAYNADNSDQAKEKTVAWRNSWAVPEAINKATMDALVETDTAKRIATYETLQREINRIGPYVFMFQKTETWAARKNVDGYLVGPSSDWNLIMQVTKN